MEREQRSRKPQKPNLRKTDSMQAEKHRSTEGKGVSALQQKIGNRAVQRLIAQRSGDGPTRIDEEVTQRIQQARSGGETLPADIQAQMGQGLGADFSQVRIHTSQESHELSQTLGAKAFTTGKDIFFKQGAYDPHTSSGKELLAHELTHVVQQGSGQAPHSENGMTVNAPGDRFEQQADQAAKALMQSNSWAASDNYQSSQVQRELEPTAITLQMQEEEEELHMQEEQEEEELNMQIEEDEEEEVQAKRG